MEKANLKAKIVEVLGEIWEQDAVLELANGQKIRVFDEMNSLNTKMVGKIKTFEIHICFPAVKKSQNKEKKIVCGSINFTSGECDFYGEVLDILEENGKHEELIVDTGVGTIEVGLDRAEYEYEKVTIGDYVEVSGGRVDLSEIVEEDEAK